MIYDSLETIPYKLFLNIAETGNFGLLSDTKEAPETLEPIWDKLVQQHLDRQNKFESKKIFIVTNNIEELETEFNFVMLAIHCLRFEYNEDLINLLRDRRYNLRDDNNENYHNDLKYIEKVAKSIKFRINALKKQLPKEETEENKTESFENLTIDDTMASYTMIVGYDIDYNTVTYSKFYAIQRQVHFKIKAAKEQQSKAKKE